MSDYELKQIICKRRQLRNLLLARERVKQLERELRGEPAKPEDAPYVPEFLRPPAPITQRHRVTEEMLS